MSASARVVAVVQARVGSTRLPRKVLEDVAGKPLIVHELGRLRECINVQEIVLATTDNPADDGLAAIGRQSADRVIRGSASDVLGRIAYAAREARADIVVRLTGDCPLIDPSVVDRVVSALVEEPSALDYVSNVIERTFPRGLDVEAMFIDTLLRLDRMSTSAIDREHVTLMLRSGRPDLFAIGSVVDEVDNSDLRWTVDEPADLVLIRTLFEQFNLAEHIVPYRELVSSVRARPELASVNAGIVTWSPGAQRVRTTRAQTTPRGHP